MPQIDLHEFTDAFNSSFHSVVTENQNSEESWSELYLQQAAIMDVIMLLLYAPNFSSVPGEITLKGN